MKNNIITTILCIFGLFATTEMMAQTDSSFNYQGQLYDNGVPANDVYDISINAFDSMGNPYGFGSEYFNVNVVDGLFNLDIFLGISTFSGFDNIFFETSVRKSSIGGSYTALSPLQALQAVPLASNLTSGNAIGGQILTFNGSKWAPANPIWTINGAKTQYLEDVAIGITANAASHRLTVKSDTDDNALRLTGSQGSFGVGAKLNFGDSNFVQIQEDTDDHLRISADQGIELASNTRQPLTMNGQMKFMVQANCAPTSSISKQYNGVNSATATISNGAIGGLCIITFPFDISDRFYQISSVEDLVATNATCQASGTVLNCARHRSSTGALEPGQIMVLVY